MMPPDSAASVFVVDDDSALCESLAWLLESEGLSVRTFNSAESFLEAYRPHMAGCLVLDIRMPGMSGTDLQAKLAQLGVGIPIIMITGHGDVPTAVRTVKAGAIDFLEKPVDPQLLLERIRAAIVADHARRVNDEMLSDARMRLKTLTRREAEVMDCVVSGLPNKQIAATLKISEKTVEVHRKRVLQKMAARNAVELASAVLKLRGGAQPSAV